jgi:hypothetical protein
MKPEQALRLLIKEHLPGRHWRIENAAGVGMPDIYGVCNTSKVYDHLIGSEGVHYWLELKVSHGTGFMEIGELVTAMQRKWHSDVTAYNQRVFVLIRCGDWLELMKCTGKDFYELVWRNRKTNTWDWAGLAYAISNQ